MAGANKEARFSIRLDSDAAEVSNEDAAALEQLRSKIAASTDSIKNMGAALRSLRGNTEDVKSAKDKLKAAIEAERASVSANNLQLLKQGTNYEKLAAQARKAAIEEAKQKKASEATGPLASIKSAGGPLADLVSRVEHLGQIAGGTGAAFGILALGIAGVVSIAAKLTTTLIDGAIALTRWALASANALRTQNLLREAATGTAVDAEHLGHQLDALAAKVATPRAELNDLAVAITRSLSGTRASGQAIVDTINAVAQASAALPGAGEQIKAIIERAKNFGRISIDPFELQGSGISRDDVAKQLAARLKIGVNEARQALALGRVSIADGAAAIRAAVEAQFGNLNLRKMLDLNVIAQKFEDTLAQLTAGIDLEPLGKSLAEIASLFSQTTVTGQSLKLAITGAANALIGGFSKATPTIEAVIKQFTIGVLKLEIEAYRVRNAWRDAFGGEGIQIDWLQTATIYARGLADAALLVEHAMLGSAIAVARVGQFFQSGGDRIRAAWDGLGDSLIGGLVEGLKRGVGRVTSAVEEIANSAKETFKRVLGIHSPSTVFAEYGEQTAEGYAQGAEAGAGRAQQGADALAPSAPSGARGGASVVVHVGPITIQVMAGGHEAAAALTGPSFLAELTEVFERAVQAAGLPTQTPVPA